MRPATTFSFIQLSNSRAGVGVAMENAIPAVAKAAAYHTLSNQADGVAYFIENHILQRQSRQENEQLILTNSIQTCKIPSLTVDK